MKTLDKKSNTMQWLSEIESNSLQDFQTETTEQEDDLYLTGQKSLLFQMYELEEEDLFV